MKKQTLLDLREYSTYLDLFSNLSLLKIKEYASAIPRNKDKYKVENLGHLMEILKSHSIQIEKDIQQDKDKRFSFILDKEGNKIELWEPVA